MMSDEIPFEIAPRQVQAMRDEQANFLLLDCREQDEFDFVHVDGSTLIPMSEIERRVGELEDYRDQSIVVLCHLGGRSAQVTNWLRSLGFWKAQNLTGGIDAWSTDVDQRLPRY